MYDEIENLSCGALYNKVSAKYARLLKWILKQSFILFCALCGVNCVDRKVIDSKQFISFTI